MENTENKLDATCFSVPMEYKDGALEDAVLKEVIAARKRAYTLELVKAIVSDGIPGKHHTPQGLISEAKMIADECEKQGLFV